MPQQFSATTIPGLLLRNAPTANPLGWFLEGWRSSAQDHHLGSFVPAQENILHTDRAGVTRGFHTEPWNRLITVAAGAAFGAWVDLRPGPGFGRRVSTRLDAGASVFVPRGVANAHQILADHTTLLHLMDDQWTPEAVAHTVAVNLFDPDLQIPWPIGPTEATVSEKDRALPTLAAVAPAQGGDTEEQRPFRVLFICTGNICRSPYAELVARSADLPGVEFSSAGTYAVIDGWMDEPMVANLPAGIDASGHRGRQLTREIAEQADLIIALSAEHRRFVLDAWPKNGRKVFLIGHVAREMASLPGGLTLSHLTDHLWTHRSADPSDEVPDPYRRGPEAASLAARAIEEHLRTIAARFRLLSDAG